MTLEAGTKLGPYEILAEVTLAQSLVTGRVAWQPTQA
jgi:hypothetical protein